MHIRSLSPLTSSLFPLTFYLLAAPFLALCDDGGTDRPGRILFDTRYVVDAGSYLTNDIAHIALQKCFNIIPDSSAVLAYSRPVGSTNETDWAQLLPERPYSAHPADYALPNAISNDVYVSIDYVPPTPAITNFMFKTAALRAMGFQPVSGYPVVVPGAKLEVAYSPRNYIQDGLIAMWDGIENAGWGVHDPNATTWTNLAQDKWHLWVNPVVVWTDNAARKPTMDGFNIATNGPALTAAEEALARTVELVVTWTGEWQHTGNSYNKVAMLFNWGQAGSGGKTFFLSGTDSNRFSVNSRAPSSTRYALSGSLSDIPVNQPFQLSADFAAEINASPTRFALNGVAVTNTTYIGRDGVAGITLGGPVAHHYYLLGDIHCVRVYDRVLTSDEVRHNLAIDRNRFNIQ